jgi:hypothetical protein
MFRRHTVTIGERQRLCEALLRYCTVDTMSLVRLLARFRDVALESQQAQADLTSSMCIPKMRLMPFPGCQRLVVGQFWRVLEYLQLSLRDQYNNQLDKNVKGA